MNYFNLLARLKWMVSSLLKQYPYLKRKQNEYVFNLTTFIILYHLGKVNLVLFAFHNVNIKLMTMLESLIQKLVK